MYVQVVNIGHSRNYRRIFRAQVLVERKSISFTLLSPSLDLPASRSKKNLQISGRGWKHTSIPCLQFSCRFLVTRFKNIFRFWHFCAKRPNRFANGAPNKSGSARERNIFIGISACRGRSSLFVSFTNCTIRWKMFNDCFLSLLPPCNPSDDETYV